MVDELICFRFEATLYLLRVLLRTAGRVTATRDYLVSNFSTSVAFLGSETPKPGYLIAVLVVPAREHVLRNNPASTMQRRLA